MSNKYLIIVTVLEGRNFVEQLDKDVTVEANFNKELLNTDPLPLGSNPKFNTELAWEVDRKSLNLFRLQRTPVKLNCFQLRKDGASREMMGYIILDIRLFQEKEQMPQWYNLMNAKYDQKRPQLLLGLSLQKYDQELKQTVDENQEEAKSSTSDHASAAGSAESRTSRSENHSKELSPVKKEVLIKPQLNKASGFYQIGPPESCKDLYSLSVTLGFAANLKQIASSSHTLNEKYYFKYTLFGNTVETEPFYNLDDPDFPAERTSVRIQSSSDVLKSYFEQQQNQEVLLYCLNQPLAFTFLPLSLLISGNFDDTKSPITVEGIYKLHPLENGPSTSRHLDKDFPMLGASVSLQLLKKASSGSAEASLDQEDNSESMASSKHLKLQLNSAKSALTDSPPEKLERQNGNPKDGIEAEIPLNGVTNKHRSQVPKEPPLPQNLFDSTKQHNQDSSQYPHWSESSSVPRHYYFNIDLRNLSLSANSPKFNCLLRYWYPFFGSAAPILTHPSVEVRPHTNITLPHSYCSFNFATTHDQIHATFLSIPLIVEMLHEEHNTYHLIGTASINFYSVLEATPNSVTNSEGEKGQQRISTCSVPLLSPEGKKMGDLQCIMSLEDYGPANIPHLLSHSKEFHRSKPSQSTNLMQEERSQKEAVHQNLPSKLHSNGISGKLQIPNFKQFTEDEFVQLAMELEAWKEQQETLFREQLKRREQEHLKALTAEWKNRDAEREMILQRRDQECQRMESKLKAALADIELREKQFRAKEIELEKERHELKLKYEKLQEKCKEETRKIKLDCEYNENLSRKRQQVMDEEVRRLQEKVAELYKKLKEKEKMIDVLQEEKKNGQEGKLNAEIHILNTEKADLERKLTKARADKQRYKENWSQTLQLNVQLQQRMQAQERAELARKESELEALQLQAITAKEQKELQDEQDALMQIRQQADKLRSQVKKTTDDQNNNQTSLNDAQVAIPAIAGSMTRKTAAVQRFPNAYIQRLMEERDALLRTGMYTENDRVITELTHLIRTGASVESN